MLRANLFSVRLLLCGFYALVLFDSACAVGSEEPPSTPESTDQERQELVAERDRLFKLSFELDKAGKTAEGINAARKGVAIQEQFGDGEANANWWKLIANWHQKLEEFNQAEEAYHKALAIKTRVLGPDHWRTKDLKIATKRNRRLANLSPVERTQLREAVQLDNKVQKLVDDSKFDDAVLISRETLHRRQMILGPKELDIAQSLSNLATVYYSMGDDPKAESHYKQALEIRREVLGEQHPDTATSLGNLGLVYKAMGDGRQAELHYKRALEIRREVLGDEHPETATSLDSLAVLYQSLGDYAKAEPLFQKTLDVRRKVLGEEHPDTIASLNQLAFVSLAMGSYGTAPPLYEEILEIRRNVLGEEHRDTIASLNNLAVVYASMKDYRKAEPLYTKVLELRRKVLGEEHPDTAVSLGCLALLYESIGEYDKAEPLDKQALAIARKALGEEHPDTAVRLHNLAALYKSMRKYREAEPLYKQALEIRQKALGEEHPATAATLNNLASLYRAMGEKGQAERLFKQALEIQTKSLGEQHLHTATSLNNLAELYASSGDYARAEPLYDRALGIMLNYLESTSIAQSQRQQLAIIKDARCYLDNLLSLASSSGDSSEVAYRHVLKWKGNILRRQKAIRALAKEPNLKSDFMELERATRQFAQSALTPPTDHDRKTWQTKMEELASKIESLESNLARQSREFREVIEPTTLENLQDALPRDVVLVDFVEYDHHIQKDTNDPLTWARQLAAFVLTRDKPVRLVNIGNAHVIAQEIDIWRQGFGQTAESVVSGSLLRERLWERIEKELNGAKIVLISPDGALGKLPFAALPGKEPDTYLIEEQSIAIIAAPQDLPWLMAPAKPHDGAGRLLLIGDVDYDSDLLPSPSMTEPSQFAARVGEPLKFGRLSGTKAELDTIRETYAKRFSTVGLTPLLDNQATEAAFRQLAPHYEVLHVATHGFFAPTSVKSALDRTLNDEVHQKFELSTTQSIAGYHPDLLSGLALAGANHPDPERDDGILTAAEVMSLDLSNANLAVLSACETGLGEVAGGEGLLGLQRAFQVSGARTVVASLWQVEDVATKDLMQRFYTNLFDGEKKMSKLEALREAQLWMLRERGSQGLHAPRGLTKLGEENAPTKRLPPFYWAAFVLSGDWQ